jgi:hypothetical protein
LNDQNLNLVGDDKIGGYSERELLILLNQSVERLETQSNEQSIKMLEIQLIIRELDTRMKIWATVIGFTSGLAASIIIKIMNF